MKLTLLLAAPPLVAFHVSSLGAVSVKTTIACCLFSLGVITARRFILIAAERGLLNREVK